MLAAASAWDALTGSALGGAVARAGNGTESRPDAPSPDHPTASGGEGKDAKTNDKLKRVLAELSQNPESVQHWHTDKAHLEGLLEQLSKTPGVHAVHVSERNSARPPPIQPRWG